MKRRYNYKLQFTPEAPHESAKGITPVTYTSYIYKVRSVRAALAVWKKTQMPILRKNGLRKWATTPVKVTRVTRAGKPR